MRVFNLGSRLLPLFTFSLCAFAATSGTVACGASSEEPAGEAPAPVIAAPPASTPAPAAPVAPPATDPGPIVTTPPVTPVAPSCGASNLCLDVSSLRQGMTPHAGRLVVVWIPLAGGVKEIAYDVPFAGTEKAISIPLANVTPPTDANAFCDQRDGSGPASKCTGTLKMGFGLVAIADDQNANGKIELGEKVLGLSDANILFSGTALKPPPKDFVWSGRPMTEAFPSGVEQGANVYTSPNADLGTLTPAAPGQKFKLQVCDTTNEQQCSVKAPF